MIFFLLSTLANQTRMLNQALANRTIEADGPPPPPTLLARNPMGLVGRSASNINPIEESLKR